MSSINILNYKDIDVNEIKFSNPEKVKGGSYISIPKYNGQPIYIQSPRLINKGLTKTEQRCSIELELDNTHLSFYEFITNIDDFNIVEIQRNSKEWFKQEFPLDVVEEFYKSPVKMARSKKAPSLKIKIPLSKGTIDCGIYNSSNQLINHSQIKEDFKVLTVLQFYGLRFLKQQVICEWVPMQIKVFDESVVPQNNYLIDDSLLSDNEDNGDELNEIQENNVELNEIQENNVELNENNVESSNPNVESSDPNVESSEPNVVSSEPNVVSSENNVESSENNTDIQEKNKICEQSSELNIDLVNENKISIENNELNELNPEEIFNNELNLNEVQQIDILNETQNSEIQNNDQVNQQVTAQVVEPEISKNNIDSLQNVINEKNERIEFLENKIRELYKYLSNN